MNPKNPIARYNPSMLKILFLGKGNSCRSQMAEGIFCALKDDLIEAFSAGAEPASLNPLAIPAAIPFSLPPVETPCARWSTATTAAQASAPPPPRPPRPHEQSAQSPTHIRDTAHSTANSN
jgi:hypothetical protein